MTRSERMKVVQNHQQDKANKAAQVAVNSRNQLDVQNERLTQLASYREEYWQKYAASGGMNTARLQDFRSFITRLDGAIEQQRNVVAQAEVECRNKQDEWLHERTAKRRSDLLLTKSLTRSRWKKTAKSRKRLMSLA